ncbi:MAG TPA: cytochrome c peroxidase [Anaeromyxobacter sp.]
MAFASAVLLVCVLAPPVGRTPDTRPDPELLGLPPITTCQGSGANAALGSKLFRDARLSADGRISCSSCHRPERAFTDGRHVPEGNDRQPGTRNSPTLINAVLLETFSWDGRRSSIEDQIGDAFFNVREHGLPSPEALLNILEADPAYRSEFVEAFRGARHGQAVSLAHVKEAIACFIRSLAAGNSAFDRYMYGGEHKALTEAQKRGLQLFRGKAGCVECHPIGTASASFTDNRFHARPVSSLVMGRLASLSARVVGTPQDELADLISSSADVAALGRFVVTREPRDLAGFRTPSLRNIAVTGPYLHDGSEETLAGIVEREAYYRQSSLGRPLNLTPSERDDVVAFLESLTSSRYVSSPGTETSRSRSSSP